MHARALVLASALLALAACSTEDKSSLPTDASTAASTTSAGTTDPTTGPTTEPTTGASSGATTDSSTGGIPTGPECQQDSDCVLVNNCCECDPKPVTAPVDPCEGNCLQSTCDAELLGGMTVACRSGRCEFADVTCGTDGVTCQARQPSCGDDRVLAVASGCWACVHPRYCDNGACTPGSCGDGWTCVGSQASDAICAPVPYECQGTPTCDCVAPYLDEFCAGGCGEIPEGLLCEDGG